MLSHLLGPPVPPLAVRLVSSPLRGSSLVYEMSTLRKAFGQVNENRVFYTEARSVVGYWHIVGMLPFQSLHPLSITWGEHCIYCPRSCYKGV